MKMVYKLETKDNRGGVGNRSAVIKGVFKMLNSIFLEMQVKKLVAWI